MYVHTLPAGAQRHLLRVRGVTAPCISAVLVTFIDHAEGYNDGGYVSSSESFSLSCLGTLLRRGQLGHGDSIKYTKPHMVKALKGITLELVACGNEHTLVTTDEGAMYAKIRQPHFDRARPEYTCNVGTLLRPVHADMHLAY